MAFSTTTENEKARSQADEGLPSWLSTIAILGESTASLVLSALLFLVALAASILVRVGNIKFLDDDPYTSLGPVPEIGPPIIFTYSPDNIHKIEEAYRIDGVVAVRGLINPDLLSRLNESSSILVTEKMQVRKGTRKGKGTQFFTVDHGVAFRDPPTYVDGILASSELPNPFLELGTMSLVPRMAARLLGKGSNESLRLIRDIFLAKDDDPYVCGHHVDDFGFWPATPESPGINAWVALDTMPPENGGGFALAVNSHKAPWRDEAHYVTGATTTSPPEGFASAEDFFQRRTGEGTCNIASAAPHLHRRMEETKRIYPMEQGDVIFHDRWMFHRTVPFEEEFLMMQKETGLDPIYRRYSLRYGPGRSVIPPGWGTEPSVLWDERNGGRTADEVCEVSGPWYLRANPADDEELHALREHVEGKLVAAYNLQEIRKKQMRPFLKRLAREQQPTRTRE